MEVRGVHGNAWCFTWSLEIYSQICVFAQQTALLTAGTKLSIVQPLMELEGTDSGQLECGEHGSGRPCPYPLFPLP